MSERPDPQDPDRDPALDRAYRASARDEPPARLDDAIRAAARREAGARPQSAGGGGLRAWRVPVSIAAMLVIGVSVVTLVREEHPQVLEVPPPAPAAPPPVLLRDAPAERQPAAAADAARAKDAVTSSPPAQAVPEPKLDTAPAAVSEQAAASAKRERRDEQEAAAAATHNATAPAAEPARRVPPVAGSSDLRAAEAPVPSTARPRPAATPARAEDSRVQGGVGQELQRAEAAPAAEGRAAPLAKAQADSAYAELDTPEKWLARIRELRKQGRPAEAAKLLAEFRQRYPGFVLPPDLQEGGRP